MRMEFQACLLFDQNGAALHYYQAFTQFGLFTGSHAQGWGIWPEFTIRLSHYMRISPHSTTFPDTFSFPFHLQILMQNESHQISQKSQITVLLHLGRIYLFQTWECSHVEMFPSVPKCSQVKIIWHFWHICHKGLCSKVWNTTWSSGGALWCDLLATMSDRRGCVLLVQKKKKLQHISSF